LFQFDRRPRLAVVVTEGRPSCEACSSVESHRIVDRTAGVGRWRFVAGRTPVKQVAGDGSSVYFHIPRSFDFPWGHGPLFLEVHMRKFVFVAAVALLSASAANAQALLADANKDGKVSQKEYQDSRRTFLLRADKDKDGKISAAEWSKGAERVRSEAREEGIDGWATIGKADLFQTLDTNKDSAVTGAEIDAYSGPRFIKIDLNHDGFVTRSEANKVEKAVAKP
jgi:hypothetical protein